MMADFRFRLATLLEVREAARDQCRTMLAESQRADQLLQEQIASLKDRRAYCEEQCRKAAEPGEIEAVTLAESHAYIESLRADEQALHEQRAQLAAEIDRRRQSLLEADREVRAIEKLRERKLQLFQLEEARSEAKRLDEIAAQTVRRSQRVAATAGW